jgi:hypothetical protein
VEGASIHLQRRVDLEEEERETSTTLSLRLEHPTQVAVAVGVVHGITSRSVGLEVRDL